MHLVGYLFPRHPLTSFLFFVLFVCVSGCSSNQCTNRTDDLRHRSRWVESTKCDVYIPSSFNSVQWRQHVMQWAHLIYRLNLSFILTCLFIHTFKVTFGTCVNTASITDLCAYVTAQTFRWIEFSLWYSQCGLLAYFQSIIESTLANGHDRNIGTSVHSVHSESCRHGS